MVVTWGKSRRRARLERDQAAAALKRALELGAYVDHLTMRCAQELETNNFGDAIRVAMRKKAAQ